ncbi:MAG TPA: LuxR C-terminal-related transcriptional regulator [Microbacteriaceae bacterium]|nr:LuxR C-terminal-related transcriptional regulator [Microbacteriaceae bacterium]
MWRELPSRKSVELDAITALREQRPVMLHGEPGSGLTSFAKRLTELVSGLNEQNTVFLTGRKALKNTEYAFFGVLSGSFPELASITTDPVGALARFSSRTASRKLLCVIDRAENIDESSAAFLTQMVELGNTTLVLTVNHAESLPEAFTDLAAQSNTAVLEIDKLIFDDAKILLNEHLSGPVNASAVDHFLREAKGHMATVVALANEALNTGQLELREGYLVLLPRPEEPSTDALGSADAKLSQISAQLINRAYAGDPLGALEEGFALFESQAWQDATTVGRVGLLFGTYLAGLCEGSHEFSYDKTFEGFDWDHLDIDHATFLASKALTALEYGRAEESLELASQALSLTSIQDPLDVNGFIAAIGAAAATLLEDYERAEALLNLFENGLPHSGHLLRPEAERLALSSIHALKGADAAIERYENLLTEAYSRGQQFIVMRLKHEAWRLGLINSFDEMIESAETVTGQFGELFRALQNPKHLEDTVTTMHSNGRTLYAAEILSQGARDAKASGDRILSENLLTLAAQLANTLPGVNTPRLARARIDPDLLTPREIEVCVQAAAGLSNAEIAEILFLSPRTVEGHLQRAYAKLKVSDRRQILPEHA